MNKLLFGAGLALFAGIAASSCSDEMNTQEARNKCFEDLLPYVAGYYLPYSGDPAGGSSSSSNGNALPSECETADDCPRADEPRCADALCVAGKCGFLFKPVAKVESQIQGDCVSQYCDGQGKVIALPDGEDVYNDGKQCTIDKCESGVAKNIPMPDGGKCPETGIGVCFDGECVDCINPEAPLCPGGLACDFTTCEPASCSNSIFEPGLGETAFDCGGPCSPCPVGFGCKVAGDCIQGVCQGGLCKAPSCVDGVKNDGETGIDCGGSPSCPLCKTGETCELPSDCASGVCWAGLCQAPTCNDGIANGDEQSVDCGGVCAACGG